MVWARLKSILLLAVFLTAQVPAIFCEVQEGQSIDHSLWDSFLKKYVNEAGELDFAAAKKDPSLLDQYLHLYSKTPLVTYSLPREEFLAFWLNIYQAVLVKVILDAYPVKNVLDIPGIFDVTAVEITGEKYSLNQIRNARLIETFRDEKIHTSLACGTRSCPSFQREAYTGPTVEGQLFQYSRAFVNNAKQNEIVPGRRNIKLSRLFKWYGKDFKLDFGQVENDRGWNEEDFAVVSFVANYLDDTEKKDFLEQGNYKIKYFPFNWALADASAGASPQAS